MAQGGVIGPAAADLTAFPASSIAKFIMAALAAVLTGVWPPSKKATTKLSPALASVLVLIFMALLAWLTLN
jgi:hypothetical protein